MVQPRLSIETISTLQGLASLSVEWRELEGLTPEANGFQSHAWCAAWILAAAGTIEVRIVVLREQGRLSMLWPLQLERALGASVLRWLGEPMAQYGDALALPGARRAAWREAIEAELRGWRDVDLIALTRLRGDGVLAQCGFAATPCRETLSAPFASLGRPMPRGCLNKSARRRGRRLAALGQLRVETAATHREACALARQTLVWKRDWLGGRGRLGSALFQSRVAAFLENCSSEGVLEAHALRVGDRVAAIDLGFVGGDAYRSLLGSFDPDFAEGSPGHVLIDGLIRRCSERGLARFDFLAPADPYKIGFSDGATMMFSHFRARNATGRLVAFALRTLRPAAKGMLAAFATSKTWR